MWRALSYDDPPSIRDECLTSVAPFTSASVRKWPFPAVQAMNSIRGRRTATCDPFWPSEPRRRMSAFRSSYLRLYLLKVDHQFGKL